MNTRKIAYAAALPIAFLIGIGAGQTHGGNTTTTPAPTVTVTAPAAAPQVQQVTVESVPTVCFDALDAAETVQATMLDGLDLSADSMEAAARAFAAIEAYDIDGMAVAMEDITAITGDLNALAPVAAEQASDYAEKAAACREAAR